MRTERGLDRFVTFRDAVVAIAITLLVLPLVELIDGSEPESSLADVLSTEGAAFFGFFLSFAVIARLWLAHHHLVEGVGAYDHAFLLLNLLWILTIVVLPFATQVVAAYPVTPLPVFLYIGTITLRFRWLASRRSARRWARRNSGFRKRIRTPRTPRNGLASVPAVRNGTGLSAPVSSNRITAGCSPQGLNSSCNDSNCAISSGSVAKC